MTFQHNLTLDPLSIYVHWPFCKSKCPYCDFNSHVRETIDYSIWNKNYMKEIEYFKKTIKGKYIKSVFFGGGTPSLMPASLVKEIINKIAEYGIIDTQTEITIEANPTSAEAENFQGYKQAGVNRLSIGIQALREQDLKFLGREHSVNEAKEVIKFSSQIFNNYSFDLIYARPNQNISLWLNELEEALTLAANHISLYQLTIEKGTPFYRLHKDKNFILPTDQISAKLFETTNNFLSKNGFIQYEVSNYCKAGFESIHNSCYWQYNDYLGVGPGAHSRISYESEEGWNMQAFAHIAKPENWLQKVETEGCGIQTISRLNLHEILTEILLMGLRLRSGISDYNFQKYFNKDIISVLDPIKLTKLSEQGFIKFSSNNIKVTSRGFKLINSILLELI